MAVLRYCLHYRYSFLIKAIWVVTGLGALPLAGGAQGYEVPDLAANGLLYSAEDYARLRPLIDSIHQELDKLPLVRREAFAEVPGIYFEVELPDASDRRSVMKRLSKGETFQEGVDRLKGRYRMREISCLSISMRDYRDIKHELAYDFDDYIIRFVAFGTHENGPWETVMQEDPHFYDKEMAAGRRWWFDAYTSGNQNLLRGFFFTEASSTRLLPDSVAHWQQYAEHLLNMEALKKAKPRLARKTVPVGAMLPMNYCTEEEWQAFLTRDNELREILTSGNAGIHGRKPMPYRTRYRELVNEMQTLTKQYYQTHIGQTARSALYEYVDFPGDLLLSNSPTSLFESQGSYRGRRFADEQYDRLEDIKENVDRTDPEFQRLARAALAEAVEVQVSSYFLEEIALVVLADEPAFRYQVLTTEHLVGGPPFEPDEAIEEITDETYLTYYRRRRDVFAARAALEAGLPRAWAESHSDCFFFRVDPSYLSSDRDDNDRDHYVQEFVEAGVRVDDLMLGVIPYYRKPHAWYWTQNYINYLDEEVAAVPDPQLMLEKLLYAMQLEELHLLGRWRYGLMACLMLAQVKEDSQRVELVNYVLSRLDDQPEWFRTIFLEYSDKMLDGELPDYFMGNPFDTF